MQQLDRPITGFRLSPQQARLWTLQRQNKVYRVQAALRLNGKLNHLQLKHGLKKLVEQHEILRTTFHRRPGLKWPIQSISPHGSFGWTEQDWCHKTSAEQQQQLDRLMHSAQHSDDHAELRDPQPPLQIQLIQRALDRVWLLFSLPALCADTTTLSLLATALIDNYGIDDTATGIAVAEVDNEVEAIEAEPVQYVQISEWQHGLLTTEDEDYQSGKAYWSRPALSPSQSIELPLEHPHTADETFNPAIFEFDLSQDLRQAIDCFSQSVDSSISHILLTGWQSLINRLTSAQSLVGVAFDGRNDEELCSALGPLTTYLPIDPLSFFTQTGTHRSFQQATEQVRHRIEVAASWQQYFTRDRWSAETTSTYFPVSFDYTAWSLPCSTPQLSVALERVVACTERFHLNLSCYSSLDTLTIQIQYDPKVIDPDAVARLADQYRVLLSQAVAHPGREISKLGLLSRAARDQLLVAFNPPPSAISITECIHQRFEQQARQTPDAPAVTCEDQTLSYGELNQQANQLAHFLQQQGVSAETPVALYLERSCSLMVGLLGILKAGGAYLPLDPALPTQGIALRLAAAQVPIVVTQSALLENCARSGPAMNPQVICLDRDWSEIATCDEQNPVNSLSPNALAYVIYTSGSTGQPKGVAVEHQQVLHYLDGIQQKLSLAADNRRPISYASVSTIAADLGNTAIFSALCTGGCLHLVGTERASNPDALAHYNQQHSIDCLKIVPSHLKALLTSAAEPAQILPRECLILGGEAASWQLIQQVQQLSNCRILNHYGPTETTVGVLAYEVDTLGKEEEEAGIVPLGRPLANSQVYLLDDHHQPVPIGVVGEIYIGGATVARGYWQQPELTAERFVDNPLVAASARLYRTGDRARYRPDGNLEFLGRLDDQVKIRGYRVELGEIETVLQQHPTVQNAVVMLREDSPGQKQLAAYVVLHQALEPAESLEAFVAQRLPAYMVPATFSVLAAFPLTPNGKVDRQALPVPAALQQAAYSAPQTDAETTLADIWAEVLGLEQVGIHDNFFSLGGDSILSIQVIARANQAGLTLTPKQLFEHQTVATLAAVAGTSALVPAEQGPVVGAVPLTPIQRWFFEQAFAAPQHWNQAVLLASEQPLTPMLLQQTIQHLRAHHDGLRSRFVCVDNAWRQEILPLQPEQTVLELIDLAAVAAEEQPAALEAHANRLQASLDLAKGALLRVALFDRGPGQSQRLLIIVHHLVMDGVSWRILLQDFQTVYQQLSQQQAVQLPPKTSSFQAWAQQLYDYAQLAELEQETDFWLEMLGQPPTMNPFGTAIAQPAMASASTMLSTVLVKLTQIETQTLLQEVPAAYNTQINDVLLTALVQAFREWTEQQWTEPASLLIDLEGHGREDLFPDVTLSRTVGWFTAVYPVHLTVETSEPGLALMAVKERLRQIPNHGVGYGLLRYGREQGAIAQLQSLPQPQVKFNYLGQFDQQINQGVKGGMELVTAQESCGESRSPLGHRDHALEIIGYVCEGTLHLEWICSGSLPPGKTIEALAQHFLSSLRSLIQHCQDPNAKSYTPSDFSEFQWSNWNQADLNKIQAAIGEN